MSNSLLGRVLDEVSRHLEVDNVAPAVERVDVGKDCALVVTVGDGGATRWFHCFDGYEPSECHPHDDPKIPFSSTLDEGSDGPAVVAYRPGRRVVVEPRDGSNRIAKAYRKRRAREAWAKHCLAASALDGELATAPSIALEEDLEVHWMERVSGRPLAVTEEDRASFAAIGRGLRRLQGADTGELAAFGPLDELDVLETWAGKATVAHGALAPHWPRIHARLQEQAKDLPDPGWAVCHRDLHDGQFVLGATGLTLLDFDLLCRADETLDAANLVAHLDLRALQGWRGATGDAARSCASTLLEAWAPRREEGFRERYRYYRATALTRLALVYSLRPRWRHLVDDLWTLAESTLSTPTETEEE